MMPQVMTNSATRKRALWVAQKTKDRACSRQPILCRAGLVIGAGTGVQLRQVRKTVVALCRMRKKAAPGRFSRHAVTTNEATSHISVQAASCTSKREAGLRVHRKRGTNSG